MPVAGNARFTCAACGKSYPWKPDLAGKRAKCKCGQVMSIPATLAELGDPQEPSLDDLYALAEQGAAQAAEAQVVAPPCPSCHAPWTPGTLQCAQCGYSLDGGTPQPAKKTRAAGSPAPAGAGMRPSRRRIDESEARDIAFKAQLTDLYLPLALLVAGTAMSIWRLMASGDMSLASAMVFFMVWVIAETIVVFGASLIAINWLGISLGEPVRAFLKIGAIIVGPFGVAMIASWLAGTWIVGFFIAPLLYYALLSYFFELDLGEVLRFAGIIYATQYIARMLLIFAILRALFGGVPPVVASLAGMALFGGAGVTDEKPDPTRVQSTVVADNKMTADMIKEDRRTQEAKEFFVNPDNGFAGLKREDAQTLFQDLYAKGANSVMANQVSGYSTRDKAEWTALLMIIELPVDPASRKDLFKKYNDFQVPRGYQEARDIKQKYLRLWTEPKIKAKAPPVQEEEE